MQLSVAGNAAAGINLNDFWSKSVLEKFMHFQKGLDDEEDEGYEDLNWFSHQSQFVHPEPI